MKKYLMGLQLIWWDRTWDNLFFLSVVTVLLLPFVLLAYLSIGIIKTFNFTYHFFKWDEVIHAYYYETVDRVGIYKCRLHDEMFITPGACLMIRGVVDDEASEDCRFEFNGVSR